MLTANINRMSYMPAGILSVVLVALSLLALPSAYAQSAIEEIVVTARKRAENLQDIPLTVSAFTEAAIEERGIANLQDIADATPGFDFAHAFGRADFRPVIRGQSNILGRANAGLFVEGFIIDRGSAQFPMSALERVEVVKGPQSALYGRSTLAGAINYVLKKPGDEVDGEVTLEYGERDQLRAEVYGSAPLGAGAGVAVTVSHYQRDGDYNNRHPGNVFGAMATDDEVGGEETTSVTAVLTLDPTERLSIQGHVFYEESNDEHYAIALQPSDLNNCYQVTRGGPLTQPAPPPGTPEASASTVTSPGYNGSGYYCGRVDVGDVLATNGGATNLETGFFDNMGIESESLRLGLRADLGLTESLTLTSLTGYSDVDEKGRQDQTFGGGDVTMPVIGVGSPFAVQGFGPTPPRISGRVGFLTDEHDEFEDISQELRLTYDADGALRYMLGFYYYWSEDKGDIVVSSDTRTSTYTDGTRLFSPFNPRFVPATVSTSAYYEGAPRRDDGQEKIESWSLFGSMEFDFTDKLSLGAELRYNEDDFEITPAGSDTAATGSFNAVLPKVTVQYKATERMQVYANIAKGNKPGTLNKDEGTPAADVEVDEETAWTFEAGIKSSWMQDRLIANVAVYHIDWRDLQLTAARAATVNDQPRTFSILQNVGAATINGVELDLAMRFNDHWDARLGYAWTDSEIDEFLQSVDAGAAAPSAFREAALIAGYAPSGDVIISGTQLPQTSKHQLNLSNTFHGDMGNGWSWFLRGDFNYNSKRYAQVYNLAHTGNRELVNLRAGVSSGSIELEVWADNVFDDDASPALIRYVQGNDLTFNPFNRAIGLTLPEERRIGVTARYRF